MALRFLRYIARLFQEEFWLFLLLAIGLAFVFPDFGRTYLKPLALPAILTQMYIVMLNIEPQRLLLALRAWRPLVRMVLIMFAVGPLLVLPAHGWYEPAIVLGLAVACVIPAGMSSPFFTLKFGGDAALAVVLTTLTHLMVPILAPLWVTFLAGNAMEVDSSLIFMRLVQLIVVPFALAWATRKILGAHRTNQVYRGIAWLAGLLILVVTWGIVADITVATVPILPLAVGVTVLNGIFFGFGLLFGGADRRTLSMTAGYRNTTLGMVLSISVWGNPLVALPSVMWTLTQNLYAVLLLFGHRILGNNVSQR